METFSSYVMKTVDNLFKRNMKKSTHKMLSFYILIVLFGLEN